MKQSSFLIFVSLAMVGMLAVTLVRVGGQGLQPIPLSGAIFVNNNVPVVIPTGQVTNLYGNPINNIQPVQRTPDYTAPADMPQVLPRTSDTIIARRDFLDQISIEWQGDQRSANRVLYGVFDKDRHVLDKKIITHLPAKATFKLTSKAKYVAARIEYINGASNTMVAAIYSPDESKQ